MRRTAQSIRCSALGLLAAAVLAHPAFGWSPATHQVIVEEAARLAPPDLARQLFRHKKELKRGTLDPFADTDAARHAKNPDGAGLLDTTITAEVEAAITAIRSHQPFAEISRRLGVVSHYMADANNPLAASDADRNEGRYFGDYLAYVEAVSPRFPLTFFGLEPRLDHAGSALPLVEDALSRSRRLYPLIGAEYRRIGYAAGRAAFDDRSTAFAISSLAFSHAVTDVAQVFRYIWLRAGGGDPRRGLPLIGERLIRLPRRALAS